MSNCSKCGNELKEGSIFCDKCGTKVGSLVNDEIASTNEIPITIPIVQKGKSKKAVFILVSIIVILALGVGGWYYYDYTKKQEAIRIEQEKEMAIQKYQDEMKKITTSISDIIKKLDSPFNDAYMPNVMLDNLDSANKVLKSLNELASDANSKIISLENIKVPDSFKIQHDSFIDSLNKYKSALEAKRGFMEANKIEIVSYNALFLQRNIYAVEKSVKLGGELDKLTNDIKSSVNNLKQRTESLNLKFQS